MCKICFRICWIDFILTWLFSECDLNFEISHHCPHWKPLFLTKNMYFSQNDIFFCKNLKYWRNSHLYAQNMLRNRLWNFLSLSEVDFKCYRYFFIFSLKSVILAEICNFGVYAAKNWMYLQNPGSDESETYHNQFLSGFDIDKISAYKHRIRFFQISKHLVCQGSLRGIIWSFSPIYSQKMTVTSKLGDWWVWDLSELIIESICHWKNTHIKVEYSFSNFPNFLTPENGLERLGDCKIRDFRLYTAKKWL